ncbi:MAG: PEP-utilizing enzyme [Candidatus Woesearchaeota archaeon]
MNNPSLLSIRKVSLFYMILSAKAVTSRLKNIIGENISKQILYYRDGTYHLIVDKDEYERLGNIYFNKFLKDKSFVDNIINRAFELAEKLIEHCRSFNNLGIGVSDSNEEFINFYKIYCDLYTEMYSHSYMTILLDKIIYNKLKDIVKLKVNDSRATNLFLQKLTQQSGIIKASLYTGYDYEYELWDDEKIKQFQLSKNSQEFENNPEFAFNKAVDELNLSDDEIHLAKTLKKLIYLKERIKLYRSESFYYINQAFEELSKQTDIPISNLKYILPEEINLLNNNDLHRKIQTITTNRINESIFFIKNGVAREISLTEHLPMIYNLIFKSEINNNNNDIKLTGVCSSVGKVIGRVIKINNKEDYNKIYDKSIIVTKMTSPELVFHMDKIAGIITDDGGSITCHAATLAREFNIPCLSGTKIATKIFSENDVIELDASENYAKILKSEDVIDDKDMEFDNKKDNLKNNYGRNMIKIEKTEKTNKTRKPVKYAMIFDEFNIIPDLCRLYGDANTRFVKETYGRSFSEMVFAFKDLKTANICHVKQEMIEVAGWILNKIIDDPDWGLKIVDKIIKDSDNMINTTEKNLGNLDIEYASGNKLWKIYKEFNDLSIQQFVSGCVPMILDGYEPLLSSYILNYLKTKNTTNVNEVFSILTTPEQKTTIAEEEIEFLRICSKILTQEVREFLQERPSMDNFNKVYHDKFNKLKKHHDKYFWLPHDFLGYVWPVDHFYEKLLNIAFSSRTPQEILGEIKEKYERLKELKQVYIKEYDIDKKHQKIIKVAQGFMYSKPYRKERFTHSFYYIYKIYREICRRFGYTLDESRWMLYEERKQLLLKGEKADKKILKRRNKGCVMISKDGRTTIIYDKEADDIIDQIEIPEVAEDINEIKGMIACQGRVNGKVRLIFSSEDMKKMKKGDILVAPATNPDVVPAMKKASAIVTDAGGVTSHAAIISRELGVPCIIGTKTATKILKDGDLVEVDAEKEGIVRIIERADNN